MPTDAEVVAAVETLIRRFGADRTPEPLESQRLEPWIGVVEAAEHAGVSTDTIRSWIQRELLPAGRCGKILRLRRSDIDKLLLAPVPADDEPCLQSVADRRAAEIIRELESRHR